MLLQSGKSELGIISHYSPCRVWAAQPTCPRTPVLPFPTAHSAHNSTGTLGSTNKWEFTLNPHTEAATGTTVSVAGSTSDHWQLLPCTHRKSITFLLSAWGAHTPSWVLCLCSWCWMLQGMNFPKQSGSSSSVFLSCEDFSLPTVTLGLSHLQAKESPAHPAAATSLSLTRVHCRLFKTTHPEAEIAVS